MRELDKAELAAGFTSSGDLYVTRGDKETYYHTGIGKDGGDAQLLKFTFDDVSLLGAGGKVLWLSKYEEPHGFDLRHKDANDPVKLCMDGYGDLMVIYKHRVLWTSEGLPNGSDPSS